VFCTNKFDEKANFIDEKGGNIPPYTYSATPARGLPSKGEM